MDAEVLLLEQVLEHRVGDGADAQLHGGAVGDQLGDMPGKLLDHGIVGLGAHGVFADHAIDRDDMVHALDVHAGIAQGAGHLLVDLGDHGFCHLRRRNGQPRFGPHGAVTLLIGWGDMDEGDIEGQMAVLEQQGKFRQQHRGEIGPPLVDGLADVGADEHGVDPQVPRHLRGGIVAGADGQGMADLDIPQMRRPFDQGLQQLQRHRGVAGQEYPVAGFDRLHRLVRGGDAGLVSFLPVGHDGSP